MIEKIDLLRKAVIAAVLAMVFAFIGYNQLRDGQAIAAQPAPITIGSTR